MSTKNLGRSIIELGRSGRDKFERNQLARNNRKFTFDSDGEPVFKYKPGYPGLRDHLSPMYAWINAQVGRPWSKVFSEFKKKVGTNSLQGVHVLSHLHNAVQGSGGQEHMYKYSSGYDYYIDSKDILRKSPPRKITRYPYKQQEQADIWAVGRKVTSQFGALFWVKVRVVMGRELRETRFGTKTREYEIERKETLAGRMSNKDVSYYRSLDTRVQWKLFSADLMVL